MIDMTKNIHINLGASGNRVITINCDNIESWEKMTDLLLLIRKLMMSTDE
jgi:hypothetical protein